MNHPLKLFLLFCLLTFSSFGKQNYSEIEKLILNEENAKALSLLGKEKPNYYTKTLRRILLNKAGYLDYLEFVRSTSVFRKFEYEQLNSLLQKNVKAPPILTEINLNYVRLKWYQINNLRNELSLDRATNENEKLKEYIAKFKNQNQASILKAKIYANVHDIVMAGISENFNLYREKCTKDLLTAERLKDTFLIMTTKYFFNSYYVNTNQVEPYIKNCKDILALDDQSGNKSGYYNATVDQLLDVYFYTEEYDQNEVERLLKKIFNADQTRYYSYTYFAKYLSTLKTDDSAVQPILALFKQPDVRALCRFLVKDATGNMNAIQLIQLYNVSARALYQFGYYQDAMDILLESNELTVKTYSHDLSESLADFKTKEIKRNKESEVKQAKEKTNFYITVTGVIAGLLILLTFLFINNRQKSIKLEEKNKENELLIKEIHHRVKNNFQTISSLIELQGKNIEDEKTIIRLKEGQSRIKSMSLIHQKLYQNDNISTIDFEEYAIQLTHQILNLYGLSKVKLTTQLHGLNLDIDTAIPMGLILNELVTNSCKYAFNENQTGIISIAINATEEGEFIFEYRDNGPGISPDFDFKKAKSLGLKLIQRLVKQLRGTFNYRYENLAIFEIKFKDTLSRKKDD